MSATALAEYLILVADKQEDILHDSRWLQSHAGTYGDAARALRAYNLNPARARSILTQAKEALAGKASAISTTPKARSNALLCIEAIELFERYENAFGTRALRLIEPPRFELLDIEGMDLSIQPDVLVEAVTLDGRRQIGAGIIRLAKAPDPAACKLDETRQRRGDHRREMARYMVAMLQMLLEKHGPAGYEVSKDLCFVADVRLGERVDAAADHTSRLRAIAAACKQIVQLWGGLTPKASIRKRAG